MLNNSNTIINANPSDYEPQFLHPFPDIIPDFIPDISDDEDDD